jgi:undecaprenyl-diphosphatase
MTIIQAIILGIVQGLTEFIPVSSSAHLVLVPYLLNWTIDPDIDFIFDVLVQVGTLVSVIIYFRKALVAITTSFITGIGNRQPFKDPQALLGWYLIMATIPASVIGLLLKDQVEEAFNNPVATAICLIVTAGLLTASEFIGKRNRSIHKINWIDALWTGFFQAAAIFPGISRSGATISGGMFRNLDRSSAAKFSFLMSVPVMIAAGLVASLDLFQTPDLTNMLAPIIIGFVTSAIVGYLAIRWLLTYLAHRSLFIFAIYCALLGLIIILSALI